MSLSYSALPRSQLHMQPEGGEGVAWLHRHLQGARLPSAEACSIPSASKGLNTTCTAYFPFCSLVGRKPDSHFFFYFWQLHVACWILVPQQGFNPSLPLEAPNVNHRTTREVPSRLLFLIKAIMLQGLVSGGPVTSELDPWQAGMSQRSDV